jgi:hypothetical protein
MTKQIVTDEQLGQLSRKQNDLFRRVREGTLPVAGVLAALQRIIEGQTQVVTVPDKSVNGLVDTAEREIGLTYLNSALRSNAFIIDERGKTYEVATWKPGRHVSSEDVRKHFRDLDPSNPYLGNTAAFVAWVTEKQPMGWHVSIPEKSRLLPGADGGLCAPLFYRGGAGRCLDLDGVAGGWGADDVFVAFREVSA